jgi:hypothetical protein
MKGKRPNNTYTYKGAVAFPFHFIILLLLFFPGCREHGCESAQIRIDSSQAGQGISLQAAPLKRPFARGISLLNAYPAFTIDEIAEERGQGVIIFDPASGELVRRIGADASGGGPWNVRSLAFQERPEGPSLWVGTLFDGAYLIRLADGKVEAHFTVESTGIRGRATRLTEDEITFQPDEPLPPAKARDLAARMPSGLYLRLNTEVFQASKLNWPEISVYTYNSHDPVHAGSTGAGGLDRVTIMTGLPDNTINSIMVDGDTVWFAAGQFADKGLSGGVAAFRDGAFISRYADAVFDPEHRFHYQRSNAALSLCLQAGRIWSGWAEIRGMKPWGGVSGNLLNFIGDGGSAQQWQDFTKQIGVNREGYAPVLHTTVSSLVPVELGEGKESEECVVAGTFSINNTIYGGGYPGRVADGGGGLRVVCGYRLRALVTKSYGKDGRPAAGSPASNAIFALDAKRAGDTGEVFAFAGTDAGLYVTELNSQLREYFFKDPAHPRASLNIGSEYLRGVRRSGEVLHGMTAGSPSWPACLPDLMVQAVAIEGELAADTASTVWVGTYGGLARYRGPIREQALRDCRRWESFFAARPGTGDEAVAISAIVPVELEGRKYLALGTGMRQPTFSEGGALQRALAETGDQFPQDPINRIRVQYSTTFENNLENLMYPDAAALNVYTQEFNEKPCTIASPGCLVHDRTLNWKHLDAMVDKMAGEGLSPIFCISAFPDLLYRGLVRDKASGCSPPDPNNSSCAPSVMERKRAEGGPAWDWSHWENLFFALTDHFYRRYGRAKVSQWGWEVWNEPAIAWLWPWHESWAEDYVQLFKHAQRGVAACNDWWDAHEGGSPGIGIKVMGPAWHGDFYLPDQRLAEMGRALSRGGTVPDVLSLHIYPLTATAMTPWYNKAQELFRAAGLARPLAVTEYGMVLSVSHDGIGTSASSELPAIFLAQSTGELYQSPPPPALMCHMEMQGLQMGTRSNWPGFFAYLGTRDYAPRPLFDLAVLTAQAGELPLKVETGGDVGAFARVEPRTGQAMLFCFRTRLARAKLWQETIAYQDREREEVALRITGLPAASYRVREFKIDGGHNNFLTALWREGSPDQPEAQAARLIKQGATLTPLGQADQALPPLVRGGAVEAKVQMEDDSIYVAELTPPPVIAVTGTTVSGLAISAGAKGGVAIFWTEGQERRHKVYDPDRRAWVAGSGELARTTGGGEVSYSSAGCSIRYSFAGHDYEVSLSRQAGEPGREGGLSLSVQGEAGFADNAIREWDGKNLGCAADLFGNVHVIYGRAGQVAYKYFVPIEQEEGGAPSLHFVGGRERVISAYEPYPAVAPAQAVIAADGEGDLHIAWVETAPKQWAAGKAAIVYLYLRK